MKPKMNSGTLIKVFSLKFKYWKNLSHKIESKYPVDDLLLRKRRYSFSSKLLVGDKPYFSKAWMKEIYFAFCKFVNSVVSKSLNPSIFPFVD